MHIGIFIMHDETYGEARRATSIATTLSQNHDVTIIQAGKDLAAFDEHTVANILTLPHPYSDRDTLRSHTFQTVHRTQIIERIRTIQTFCLKHPFDVFITMSFPFFYDEGARELIPFLQWMKNNYPKTKIIASIGYPLGDVHHRNFPAIIDLYDEILVHCPSDVDGKYLNLYNNNNDLYSYLQNNPKKVSYTNYIIPKESTTVSSKTVADFVLVTRGSGIIHENLIKCAIATAKKYTIPMKIVLGSCSEQKYTSTNNIEIHEYVNQKIFSSWIAQAKAVVSMAGYGTACQLLYFNKTASVVVPKDIDTEQIYRSHLLQDMIGSRILHYKDLTPDTLYQSIIDSTYATPRSDVPKSWFTGLLTIEKIFSKAYPHQIAKTPS